MTQLLFLDTFSHEETGLNLDLVQFPSTVIVEEVRVIPLGGKIQINLPTGKNMRLGATLPTEFTLEFFVNDLTKPTSSTFQSLGTLDYNHQRQIRFQTGATRILTDGLVLRGNYSAVTLAVYGVCTPTTAEELALLSSAPPPTEPELVAGNHEVPIPVHHGNAMREQQKQPEWAPSWPPPVPDPVSSSEKWTVENGQRMNDDYHHNHHHRGNSGSYHHHSSTKRPRTPQRDERSRTRSPPRRHGVRRSLTPKSPPPPLPPNNGLSSPNHRKRPSITDEPAILDDVSDISDGDIPEDDFDPATATEAVPEPETAPITASDAEPEATLENNHNSLSLYKGNEQMMDIPEDMEEISDEEADWSDDGDCFFLDPFGSYDMDFGPGWVDPITVFKSKEHELTKFKVYRLFDPVTPTTDEKSDEHLEESLAKLADDAHSEAGGSDWVETLELIDASRITSSKNLRTIICRGLSLENALKHSVHTFKVRHLKSSLKFTCAVLSLNLDSWMKEDLKEILEKIVHLIVDTNVADPIRVLGIRSLHLALDHTMAVPLFVDSSLPSQLLEFTASQKLSTRLKVGLSSIVQRVSLFESFQVIAAHDLEWTERLKVLQEVLQAWKSEDAAILSFLSNEKCGVMPHVLRDMFNSNFLSRTVKLCQSVKEPKAFQEVVGATHHFLFELAQNTKGLLFMGSFPAEMEALLALKGVEGKEPVSDFVRLCLQALIQLDSMARLCRQSQGERIRMETFEMLEAIKNLYGLTFEALGREAVVHVLSKSEMLRPIVTLVQHSGAKDEEDQQKKDMKKSAIRGYACELLLMTVRLSNEIEYLYHYQEELLSIGRSDENSKLFELTSWLQWLDATPSVVWKSGKNGNAPDVDLSSVEFVMATIKQNMDKISPLSCDLVMAIRFLHKLIQQEEPRGVSPAMLQAYSADFCEHGVSILNKICGYHEQPHLHTATFAGYNGHQLMAMIHLVMKLLKHFTAQRISCLDEGFQDVSFVSTVLKTLTLCTVVSKHSDSHRTSLATCADIVDLMISFTAVPLDMSQGKTTVWQLMLIETIKYVVTAPHTYLPGLKILTEILPLPLSDGNDGESNRNMWSAQLYGLEKAVKQLICQLLTCRAGSVERLLRRVCHQLADLSAPIATFVAEALWQALKDDGVESLDTVVKLLRQSAAVKIAFQCLMTVENSDGLLRTLNAGALAAALLDPRCSLTDTSNPNDVQATANALPDREVAFSLMSLLVSTDSAQGLVSVCQALSKSLLGMSLLRGCLIRHKNDMASKLQSMDGAHLSDLCAVLLTMVRYVNLNEMREIFDWSADDEERAHFLHQDPVRTLPVTHRVLEVLQGDAYKCEDLEVDWPQKEPLLDQFSKRRNTSTLTPDVALETQETSDKPSGDGVNLIELIEANLPKDFDLLQQVKQVCDEKTLESEKQKKKAAKKSLLESKALANKNLISSFKAGGTVSIRGGRSVFNRGPGGQRADMFRSRPPNTSRPPSLHVDDFLVLQSRGQQPTGPTGYNKQSLRAAQELFAEKEAKTKGSMVGFREATKEPVYDAPSQVNDGGGRVRSERTSNYRGVGSGNARNLNRDRYGGSSNNSRGRGPPTPSPNRDNRSSRSGSDHRVPNHPRRSGGKGDNRRGGGKDRNKGKPPRGDGMRSGNARAMLR